ncbi:unnamed protein product [Bursaphelenchus okinawaensis]|uniref:AMMECR1 domain-containing protein n=1 Tax=Bursaphelenchus okinawaensis TaxID=465554 RepID=A0A811KLK6_9BILA|nr:unnamed protein product [Bursaphelenchus okinawaensis]CAG9106023.1 unnamed protein product [Bursaphelenchus okinawaensis]
MFRCLSSCFWLVLVAFGRFAGSDGAKTMTISIDMPVYCFDVIITKLQKGSSPPVPSSIPNDNFPLFVTWKKGNGHHLDLRGCIGTFSVNLPLHKGLTDYAKISAFEDSRFRPISLTEVPQLHCTVSLLVKFEQAPNYRDWIIGTHGVHIYFKQNGQNLSAVYLPEVVEEQGWDHVETLNQLMKKGGWKGQITENDRLAVRVERFQSEKLTLSYQDYLAQKNHSYN